MSGRRTAGGGGAGNGSGTVQRNSGGARHRSSISSSSSSHDHDDKQQEQSQESSKSSGTSRNVGANNRAAAVAPRRSASGRGVRRGSTWREANANGPPRRMEVSIPQKNLRVFASAVQCLMKVGKELFIEATADQLILRTLNDAKSAFAAFYFNDSGGFFETFRCDASKPGHDRADGQQESFDTQGSAVGGGSVSCKVLVRAVHSILRTLKKVVRLVIYVEGEDDGHIEPHLVFQMYCEFGYRKVHRFSLQDCEIMHAVFDGEGASRLSCPPVQLSQLLEHIHGTAEVAVGASHEVLTVRSYHHPLTGSAERAVLKTEMSIGTVEFDTYRFFGAEDEEVELVFSLKEIKALLHFSEATEAQTLEMLFREGGDPLLFQSHSKTFAAELIMATMEPRIIRKDPPAPPPQMRAAGRAEREPQPSQGDTQDSERGREGHQPQNDQNGQDGWDAGSETGAGAEGGGEGEWTREDDGRQPEDRVGEVERHQGWGGGWEQDQIRGEMEDGDGGDGGRVGGGGRGGGKASQDSETTMAPAPLHDEQEYFENDPFGEATNANEPHASSNTHSRRGRPINDTAARSSSSSSSSSRAPRRGTPALSDDRNDTNHSGNSNSNSSDAAARKTTRRSRSGDDDDDEQRRLLPRDDSYEEGNEPEQSEDEEQEKQRAGARRGGMGGGGQRGQQRQQHHRDRHHHHHDQHRQEQQWRQHGAQDGNDDDHDESTEEPQSEMPTQFPGLRAAFDSGSGGGGGGARRGGGGFDLGSGRKGVPSSLSQTASSADGAGSRMRRSVRRGGDHQDENDDEGGVQELKKRRRLVHDDDDDE